MGRDMLADGAAWLEERRREHMTRPVSYRRSVPGETEEEEEEILEVVLRATKGRTVRQVADDEGILTRVETQDWIVAAGDLVLGGAPTLPQPGDEIVEPVDGVEGGGMVYRAAPIDREGCWSWHDPHTRSALRIHTFWSGSETDE